MNKLVRIPTDGIRKPSLDSIFNNLLTEMYLIAGKIPNLIVSRSLIQGIGQERFESLHVMPDGQFQYDIWRAGVANGGPTVGVFLQPKHSSALESLAAFSEFSFDSNIEPYKLEEVSWIDQDGMIKHSPSGRSSILIVALSETGHLKSYKMETLPSTAYSVRDLISQIESYVKSVNSAALAYPGYLDIAMNEIGISTVKLLAREHDRRFGWHPFHGIVEALIKGVDLIVDYSMFPTVKLLKANP